MPCFWGFEDDKGINLKLKFYSISNIMIRTGCELQQQCWYVGKGIGKETKISERKKMLFVFFTSTLFCPAWKARVK